MKIVWNSFQGRFSDNPRALWAAVAERADLEHVWLADPAHAAAFPDGVATVDVTGPEAGAALESADLVVANTHTEVEWEKAAGTTYVQTWHGTPLKRIHHDVLWAPPGRLDHLDRDVAKWDLLLSPNPVSTPRLRQAFRYDGELLETGYPRNDVLADPGAALVRARVRAALGLGEGTRVVLYAPTWRDQEVLETGTAPISMPDLADAVPGLGGDAALLVRAHNFVTGRALVRPAPGVHDVSTYPDIAELYCAADVLVTDYSSTMFDFAVTGRPIVHLAYDLDAYRSSIRGLYADLESVAAGPVVAAAEELGPWLGDLAWAREAPWAARLAAFRDTYAVLEDGHATERVLALLGLG